MFWVHQQPFQHILFSKESHQIPYLHIFYLTERLFYFSNIKENLLFLGNLRSKLNIKELANLCRDFHLDLNDKKLLRNYSIGMKQKMGIIQAIMENQDILIFDEPTRGLDDYSIEVFIKKMKDLIEKGKTVIIASHDFVDIGYSRFITMKNGKLYGETAE